MEYEVEVIETLKRQKVIEADSLNQALEKLQEEYKNCNIILNENDFVEMNGEAVLNQWFSTNFNVEVHAYVKNGKFCVVNNTYEPQKTTVYRGDKSSFELEMAPNEIKWYMI